MKSSNGASRQILRLCIAGAGLFSAACMVGPNYKRPPAPAPPAFKEEPPPEYKEVSGWKTAQPNDGMLKGKWWEIFNDPVLNALEEQVAITNQNVLQSEAQYREARSVIRADRAALFPTVSSNPSITTSRAQTSSAVGGGNGGGSVRTVYTFPASVSWGPDLWGSIRRNVAAASATAQASAAQLENARLLYQSELAGDYFQLRGNDASADLLARTLVSYREYLKLTQIRYAGGVASDLDVAQAESQLYATQAALQDLGIQRATLEHAIAVLIGKPPAELSLEATPLKGLPPAVPVVVPSLLLERRPDIAASERQMAAANEQIGIATAAFYPSLTLSGAAGFESGRFTTWISWPSHFFSMGPAVAETIFDAGRRRAVIAENQAAFDATIASYRETVLTAFQQVEDNLATLRVLEEESHTADQSVASAERALRLSDIQYRAGTAIYLTVITAQATALSAERNAVDLLTRRFVASVSLVQALGGGWDSSQLPSIKDVAAKGSN